MRVGRCPGRVRSMVHELLPGRSSWRNALSVSSMSPTASSGFEFSPGECLRIGSWTVGARHAS